MDSNMKDVFSGFNMKDENDGNYKKNEFHLCF